MSVFLLNNLVYWTFRFSIYQNNLDYSHGSEEFGLVIAIQTIMFLEYLLTFALFKLPLMRRYPLLILLWLTWTSFLTSSVMEAVFSQTANFNVVMWIIYFFGIAILLPVRWRWHLLSQGIVLGLFNICYFVLNLEIPLEAQVKENKFYYVFVYSYLLLVVCLIADAGVFLYEKHTKQEFELRRQLKLFVHTVSHDLRSPMLGSIWLLKSLVDSAGDKIEVSSEILNQIVASSDRQLKLIDSLLEAHYTETNGIAIRPRPVCIDTLVSSIVTQIKPFLNSKNASITKKIPKKLPLVNIDPLQIRRVYDNLIANALEYNQPGLHLTLTVEDNYPSTYQTRKASDRWIYCTVSDDGIGISPRQSSQIFDLYTRASSNKQSLNTGLGLYICRQIITAHGGKIGVNDSFQGASFWFTLPIAI